MSFQERDEWKVQQSVLAILNWRTDVFSVDHTSETIPHTLFIFVPGNPGLVEWYLPVFCRILCKLGPGYAARGAALAGHSLEVDRQSGGPECVSRTVMGQSLHKLAYIEHIIQEFERIPKLVLVGHSIGCHFINRLCLWRPTLMEHIDQFFFLMPFIRMKAPRQTQRFLDFGARDPERAVAIYSTILGIIRQACPRTSLDWLLQGKMPDDHSRRIAVDLIYKPFVRNFLILGLEEIRDVPQEMDTCGWQFLLSKCRQISLLNAGNDQWSTKDQIEELLNWKRESKIENLFIRHEPSLQHDFVSVPQQISTVVDFIVEQMSKSPNRATSGNVSPRSRL